MCLVVDGTITFDELVGAAPTRRQGLWIVSLGQGQGQGPRPADPPHTSPSLRELQRRCQASTAAARRGGAQHHLAEPPLALGLPKRWLVRMHTHENAVLQGGFSGHTVLYLCLNLAAVPGVQVWRSQRYQNIGFALADYQLSEDAAVSSLCTTAGGLVNHIFDTNHNERMFTIHPIKRGTDTQVRVSSWIVPLWHATETGATGNPPWCLSRRRRGTACRRRKSSRRSSCSKMRRTFAYSRPRARCGRSCRQRSASPRGYCLHRLRIACVCRRA